MINWLWEPLQFEFMRNALAVGILLGILCAVVGTYLIVRQLGMMAHAIAHSVLPGLAIAFFLKIDLSLGAFIIGIISAWIVALVESKSKIKSFFCQLATSIVYFIVFVNLIYQKIFIS